MNCFECKKEIFMLEEIFNEQEKLNKRIKKDIYEQVKTPIHRKKWILRMLLALDQEKAEAIDSLSWKWWKKQDDDIKNLQIELVDMLHFLVSCMQFSGMTAKDVYDLYMKKNKLNIKRQDGGYKEGTYKKIINGREDNETI